MSDMFRDATVFNQEIGNWETSNAKYMWHMFCNAKAFNQDIGSWNVARVTNMTSIFSGATSFRQNMKSWDVSRVWVCQKREMFEGTRGIQQVAKFPSNSWY
jgi:surface protein